MASVDFSLLAFLAALIAALAALYSVWRATGGGGDALARAFLRQERVVREEMKVARSEAAEGSRALREEVAISIQRLRDAMAGEIRALVAQEAEQITAFSRTLAEAGAAQARRLDDQHGLQLAALKEMRELVQRQLGDFRHESGERAGALADGVARSLGQFREAMQDSNAAFIRVQKDQSAAFEQRLNALSQASEQRSELLSQRLEAQLELLRTENVAKLEQMRATVDEKLQGTLEQRLGDSFRLVSERLEAVHKGLGEVQTLATGVGDLKRVLTNVKTRGGWGEVQLGALLEQILAPGQFATNVKTRDNTGERVEFAIRLPGSEDGQEVLLPVDAKFPVEDYERLQAAAELGDPRAVEVASAGLEARIRQSARDISSKYLNPPRTTDFAILFLPTEGLFAEVIRRTGLVDAIQRDNRVVIAGPTTLVALLNSLQMGFRTLAIQKRSGEVWQVLGAVKTEFDRFGGVLEKVGDKLHAASKEIETANVRRRAMDRKLRSVERLPEIDAAQMFGPLEEAGVLSGGEDG